MWLVTFNESNQHNDSSKLIQTFIMTNYNLGTSVYIQVTFESKTYSTYT